MSASERFGFVHYFQAPRLAGAPVFISLHGIGGSEHDLVPLIAETNQDAGIVSPRGGVSCEGKACYFQRNSDGSWDPEHLQEQAKAGPVCEPQCGCVPVRS